MYYRKKQHHTTSFLLIFRVIGIFFLLCTACQNGKVKEETPQDLLEQKTFESLLTELYLVEGDVRSHLRSEHFDSLRMRTTAEINAVYQKYNIDHKQFLKNYAYYMQDLDLSEEVMKNVVNQLTELQAKEEAKEKAATKEKDSTATKIDTALLEKLSPLKFFRHAKAAEKK
jgi:hypothetical protein